MSGTPVQNSLDDLESLVKFLRIPILDNSSIFRRLITGTSLTGISTSKPNYDNLRVLLGSICLRRDTSILSDLKVSSRVHRPALSESERQTYKALENACKERIKAAVNFQRGRGKPRTILTAILLLRIFCNTGIDSTLTFENFVKQSQADEISSLKLQNGETTCIECNTDVTLLAPNRTANKRHLLDSLICHQCMSRTSISAGYESSLRDLLDSDCEAAHTAQGQEQSVSTNSSVETPHTSQAPYPSKLMALLADIKEHYGEEKRFDKLPTN
jgi:SNF2 family DNA or RNA helicase